MKSWKGMRWVLAGVLVLAMATAGIAQEVGEGTKTTTKEKTAMVEKPVVVMETSVGNIHLELDAKKAPITVSNFLSYVREGFYDGLIFHRVIDNFMIQTGGFEPGMTQKRGKQPIKNEAANGLKNDLGTIAMARTAVVNSATSQFFINVKDNTFLNHRDETQRGFGYCVFGKVVKGMEVVDKIKKVKTTSKAGHGDVPVEPVLIKRAYVAGEEGEKEADAQTIKAEKTSSPGMKAEKLDPGELERPKK